MNKQLIGYSLGVLGGAAGGFGLGYFIAKTRTEALYDQLIAEEIASIKAAFNETRKAEFGTPASAAAALIDPAEQGELLVSEIKDDLHAKYVAPYTSVDGTTDAEVFALTEEGVVTEGVVRTNVFDTVLTAGYPNPEDENAPYLITVDQFHEEEQGYDKNSIVYYEGDNSLADETEALIVDITNTVGDDFWQYFGQQSGDENIVYFRNDRLSIDFEIAKDDGKYSEKVMGNVPEADEEEPAEVFEKTVRRPRRIRDARDD